MFIACIGSCIASLVHLPKNNDQDDDPDKNFNHMVFPQDSVKNISSTVLLFLVSFSLICANCVLLRVLKDSGHADK